MTELLSTFLPVGVAGIVSSVLNAALVLVAGYFLVKFLLRLLQKILARTKLERPLVAFTLTVLRIVLLVLLVLTAMDCLHINMTPILTALASAGLAVSLALQDSLKNLAGGVYILFVKPFTVDNFVDIGGSSGTVREIGLMNTVLTTPDNKVIFIPNASISSSVIVNYSTAENRRLDLKFSIAYGDDVEKAKTLIRQVLDQNDMILREPEAVVRVVELGASSVDLSCYAWVRSENYWPATYDLREQVKAAFDQNGITIPYSQLDVHLDQN